jgi:D-glycero-D-manno-heptose 1,7-bisphosphate phosphatase
VNARRPAVFLDRDGTLIEEAGFLDRLERVRFFPYSVDAVRLLNRAGFALVVVTNQSGIARGFFDDEFVRATHRHISTVLAAGGARVDGFYYCPHHPEGTVERYRQACACRKPGPGLLLSAAADHQIDLARSFVVGDRASDANLAAAVGAASVLVRTGYGADGESAPTAITANLRAAVSGILRQP